MLLGPVKTVSNLGTAVKLLGVPLVAITTLQVSTVQAGGLLLALTQSIAITGGLVGALAGAVVVCDRVTATS